MTAATLEPVKPKKRLWRRILKWLLILILVLVLIAVAAGVYLWTKIPRDNLDPVQPGALSVSTEQTTLRTGDFEVEVLDDQLRITENGIIAWQSQPGVAFLSAANGSVDFTEHLGYFWADVTRTATMPDQSVDSVEQRGPVVRISGQLSGASGSADYTMTLLAIPKTASARALQMEIAADGVDSVVLTAGIANGERIFGLGEQYRPLDLTGTITPILPREQGIGRGEQPLTYLADVTQKAGGTLETTYAAWPSYVTSENKAFTFANTSEAGAFTVADFSRNGQASLEAWAPSISAEIFAGTNPKAVIAAREAGKTRPPLADWVQRGAVLGLQGGTDKVRTVVEEMQAAGTAISGVWLQDWTGKRTTSFGDRLWWTWQLDKQRYPGWTKLVKDLNDEGIEVLTYINPWLVDPAPKGDASIKNLYQEAIDKGYTVQTQSGQPYLMDQNGFEAVLVDFTNPAARAWYADVIAEDVLGAGAVGFMADFGEALPFDAKLFDGDPLLVHNQYPQLWASVVREGCDQAGQPECLAFMRSSFLGSPEEVPMMWNGDQMVNYADQDGMASAVYAMLSGGISGSPLWHSDIGGYTSINAVVKNYTRPPELNQRWAQMQAFGVMMRTHEGNRPAQNQQVYDTPETRAAFAAASQIYAALYPYRKTVIDEAVATGVPAMRPTWMVYPDSTAASADLQFFLGDHLLVAPVLKEGATTVSVAFPPGEWINVLTGESFAGDQTVEVPAPLDTPAAFVEAQDPVGEQILRQLSRVAE
ncbi:MAG: alpha-glucosidase [Candidatus Nanopelagicales bacterium]|nr:alpha-glucosidase [Candidatus Nanopelagicales bacterium]